MKKIFLSTVITFACIAGLSAQATEFDAMRMAQSDIIGTARYMGMAGAFGALGGDVSAIRNNPAGLGIYRSSEMTATFNIATQRANANWGGQTAQDDFFGFGFNNVALVLSSPTWNSRAGNTTGLLQSNWGFSYNRVRNFNRDVTVRGNDLESSLTDYLADFTNANRDATFDNFNVSPQADFDRLFNDGRFAWKSLLAFEAGLIDYNNGWRSSFPAGTVDALYHLRERGHIDEFSFSWGGNFSNRLYLGAALNIISVNYRKIVEYNESFSHYSRNLNTFSEFGTRGNGLNANFGIIVRPIDQLRLGISYQTPTVYSNLRDDLWDDAHFNGYHTFDAFYNYQLRTPGRLTASAGYIFGRRAMIGADVSFVNFRSIRLFDDRGSSASYGFENDVMRNQFNRSIIAKIGAEYRLTDNLSLRAGAAKQTATMSSNILSEPTFPMLNTVRLDTDYFIHRGTTHFTAGIGYRSGFWYFDAAFVNRNFHEDFMPYASDEFSPASVVTRNFDVVATVGFRF